MLSTFSIINTEPGHSLECFVYTRRRGHRTDEDGKDEACWVYPLAFLGSFPSGSKIMYTLRFSCALFFGGPNTRDLDCLALTVIDWPTTPQLLEIFDPCTDPAYELLSYFPSFQLVRESDVSPEQELRSIQSREKHFAFGDTECPSFSWEASRGIVKGSVYDPKSNVRKTLDEIREYIVRPNLRGKINHCHAKGERKKVTNRLRRQVMERDGFKCVDCGRSPQNDSSCVLHVDHRLAIANGGTSAIGNLQTLCDWCNLGKKTDHDWKLE